MRTCRLRMSRASQITRESPARGTRPMETSRPQRFDEKRSVPMQAPVAQWIEQPPPKGQVAGSIPAWGAKIQIA